MKWKERELEDWIVANPERLFRKIYPIQTNDYPLQFELLGRQIPCENGIIDLVYATWCDHPLAMQSIWVLELKAVPARAKAAEQVLRYAAAIEDVNLYEFMEPDAFRQYGHLLYDNITIEPAIIAPDFDKSTGYMNHRFKVAKMGHDFAFEYVSRESYANYDDTALSEALRPAARRAIETAKLTHFSRLLRIDRISAGGK